MFQSEVKGQKSYRFRLNQLHQLAGVRRNQVSREGMWSEKVQPEIK